MPTLQHEAKSAAQLILGHFISLLSWPETECLPTNKIGHATHTMPPMPCTPRNMRTEIINMMKWIEGRSWRSRKDWGYLVARFATKRADHELSSNMGTKSTRIFLREAVLTRMHSDCRLDKGGYPCISCWAIELPCLSLFLFLGRIEWIWWITETWSGSNPSVWLIFHYLKKW